MSLPSILIYLIDNAPLVMLLTVTFLWAVVIMAVVNFLVP
jgi:hypothetical protein